MPAACHFTPGKPFTPVEGYAAMLRWLTLLAVTFALVATTARAQQTSRDAYRTEVVAAARRSVLPIRACYDEAPRNFWRALRTMTLRLDGAGAVLDLSIAPSGPATSRFRECLLPVVRGWRFTPPQGGAALSLTFPFQEIRDAVEHIIG